MSRSIPDMQRRYVFRADASPEMGTGHVMRLFSIIEEFLERKKEVLLVGSIQGVPWLEKRIETLGNKLEFVGEHEFTSDHLRDVLIIDSYTLNPEGDFLDKKKWLRIVALIDLGTPKYKADLYIHCGTNSKIEQEFKSQDSEFIGGLKYLPIRKQMHNIQFKPKIKKNDTPLRIVVVGGGTDPNNFVGQVAKELESLDSIFDAVLFASDNSELSYLDSRFLTRTIGLELENELKSADLVLTLSGTSSWDYLSSGFPIGIVLGFENQRDNFEFQISNEIAIDIGAFDKEKNFRIKKSNLLKLIENTDLRLKLSENSRFFIDQHGAARIAKEIMKLRIQ